MAPSAGPVLGIDLGTLVTKAAVFDARGRENRRRIRSYRRIATTIGVVGNGSGGRMAGRRQRLQGCAYGKRRQAKRHRSRRRHWSHSWRVAGGQRRRSGSSCRVLGRRPCARLASARGGEASNFLSRVFDRSASAMQLGCTLLVLAWLPEKRASIPRASRRGADREGLYSFAIDQHDRLGRDRDGCRGGQRCGARF
jgi:hypothetical protein